MGMLREAEIATERRPWIGIYSVGILCGTILLLAFMALFGWMFWVNPEIALQIIKVVAWSFLGCFVVVLFIVAGANV